MDILAWVNSFIAVSRPPYRSDGGADSDLGLNKSTESILHWAVLAPRRCESASQLESARWLTRLIGVGGPGDDLGLGDPSESGPP